MAPPIQEPEETLETKLVALLAAACSIPVEGVLAPTSVGSEKRLSADTFVGVKVDQSSQDGDYAYRAPMTYAATVAVHCAMCDDATGSLFRNECRAVRTALTALTGDGCNALDESGSLVCGEFMINSTSTSFEAGENPVNTKSYSATIKCRVINSTTEA